MFGSVCLAHMALCHVTSRGFECVLYYIQMGVLWCVCVCVCACVCVLCHGKCKHVLRWSGSLSCQYMQRMAQCRRKHTATRSICISLKGWFHFGWSALWWRTCAVWANQSPSHTGLSGILIRVRWCEAIMTGVRGRFLQEWGWQAIPVQCH